MARFNTIASFVFLASYYSLSLGAPLTNLVGGDLSASTVNNAAVGVTGAVKTTAASAINTAVSAGKSVVGNVAPAVADLKTLATSTASVNAAANVNVQSNLLLNVMNSCNNVASGLSTSLNSLTQVVLDTYLVPTCTQVADKVDTAIVTLDQTTGTLEASTQAALYLAFKTLAMTLQASFVAIAQAKATVTGLAHKETLQAILLRLQSSLHVMVEHLFSRVSTDLDSLNLRTSLFANLQTAINACA